MRTRRLLVAGALALAAFPAHAQPAEPDPLAPVRLYASLKRDQEGATFSARLLRLYRAAVAKSRQLGEPVSGLDFSPAFDGQDVDEPAYRRSLRLALEPGAGASRQVRATFRPFANSPQPVRVIYTIVREGAGWKIDDIRNTAPGDRAWVYSALLALGAKGQ